jgi:hypothetical protein
LRIPDARFALQNGLQNVRLLSELQRFLLIAYREGPKAGEIIFKQLVNISL